MLQEERRITTGKTSQIQNEYENMREQLRIKGEEAEINERELRKLQERYREALSIQYSL